jgi:hypothetical protein
MDRNAQDGNNLEDVDGEPRTSADRAAEAAGMPPFTFTPLGPDPTMGWAGWGSGSMAEWTEAQAALKLREEREEEGREGEDGSPRREPREG